MIGLTVVLLLFILSSFIQADNTVETTQVIVIFRFDDYSSRSSTDMEVKLIDAFVKYNVPCTFGVIPYVYAGNNLDSRTQDILPLSPVKADILKDAIKSGILEVALHGYSHQTIRKIDGYTEFSGLDYISQVERIAKGKNLLEKMLDTKVTTFIPPWDSYDLNTILALEKQGFRCISASKEGDAKKTSLLKFLPATCNLLQLRDAVKSARLIPDIHPVIIVLFHEFNFLEIDKKRGNLTYKKFVELLGWLSNQKDILVKSVDQTTRVIDDLSARRLMNYSSCIKLSHFIPPPFLNKLYPVGVYLTSKHSYKIKIIFWVFILLFYPGILLISFAVAYFGGFIVFPLSGFVALTSRYGSVSLLALFSIYVLYNLKVGYRGVIVIAVFLGACTGIWSSFIRIRNQGHFS